MGRRRWRDRSRWHGRRRPPGNDTIVATPHVSSKYDNDPATIARLVGEVNGRLADDGLAVNVVPGAEIAMTRFLDVAHEALLGPAARRVVGGFWWSLRSRRPKCAWTRIFLGLRRAAIASCWPIPSDAPPFAASRGCWSSW